MKLFSMKKRPLVVTIHGFGKNLSHELDGLCRFLESHGFDTWQFDIYDVRDPEDADWHQWVQRCEDQVRKAMDQQREVILLGFSMGGVIASYLASLFHVDKLVLVAPAFHYLDFQKVAAHVAKRKKEEEIPSSAQTKAFREIVSNCRDAIGSVSCPVLIVHGTEDEIIDPSSSEGAWKKIPHDRKRLIFLQSGRHKMLYDGRMEKTIFEIILLFLEGRLL